MISKLRSLAWPPHQHFILTRARPAALMSHWQPWARSLIGVLWLLAWFVAAPAVAGISLVGTASNTGTTNVTVTLPGGVQQDDVVYVWACSSSTSDINVAEGSGNYAELADLYSNDNTDINCGLYRRVQPASPDTSVTVDAGDTHAAVMIVLRCVDTATPEDAATTTIQAQTNGGTPNPPSITTVTDNAWVLPWGGSSEADAVSNPPTNYGNLIDIQGTAVNAMGATRLIAAFGAEDPGTYADVVGTVADSWVAATLAARPDAGAGCNPTCAPSLTLLGAGEC